FSRLLQGASGVVFALLLLGCGWVLLHLRSRGLLSRTTLGLLVLSLIVVDLASLGAHTELELNDPTTGFQHPAAIAFLKGDPEYYRIDTRTEVWNVWQPDLSLLHGIHDVWGIYNPLVLADYDRYWEGLGSRSTALYDFLNAKYVIAHKDIVLDWDKFVLAFDADPTVNIYRNTRVLPRASVVHNAWSVPDQQAAWSAIHRADFDPATTVVVEEAQALAPARPASAEARILAHTNNEIRLQASTSAPGYLVTSEVYYPGWEVEVNGRPAELQRANYAFRAVFLDVGTHTVRFYFQPSSWRIGLACSILTWAGLGLIAVRRLASGRRLPRLRTLRRVR
ncbi:MAG: YfhO family protein, partial [Chloroflexi bacterium]|nr:YfhO family protein [Chloroflexota bacterium]